MLLDYKSECEVTKHNLSKQYAFYCIEKQGCQKYFK